MVQNTGRGCLNTISTRAVKPANKISYQNDDAESSSRQQQIDPALNLRDLDIESGRNDTGLVQPSIQLDDNFAGTVIIDNFEFTDVA